MGFSDDSKIRNSYIDFCILLSEAWMKVRVEVIDEILPQISKRTSRK
jgi:hypothetical protein